MNKLKFMTFTIEQIRNYLLSQDSLGDIMYNLSEENILKSNVKEEEEDEHIFPTEDDLVLR